MRPTAQGIRARDYGWLTPQGTERVKRLFIEDQRKQVHNLRALTTLGHQSSNAQYLENYSGRDLGGQANTYGTVRAPIAIRRQRNGAAAAVGLTPCHMTSEGFGAPRFVV
jgi:hypothetical protein